MSRRLLATTTVLAVVLAPVPSGGHAFLVKSAPARRAVINRPLERVELWFNERLEPAYSSLTVTDEAGVRVDRGDVAVDPGEANKLSVSLLALEPGCYTVSYRVLSVDGHVVESSFPFSVRRPQ